MLLRDRRPEIFGEWLMPNIRKAYSPDDFLSGFTAGYDWNELIQNADQIEM